MSTKPFLQYAAWGMPFLLHSATKFHSSFILNRAPEAEVTLLGNRRQLPTEGAWPPGAQAQSSLPAISLLQETGALLSTFRPTPPFLFPLPGECRGHLKPSEL